MSSTDHNKPTGKHGRRNRKAEQRNQKSDRQPSPKPDHQAHANEPIETTAAPTDAASGATSAAADTVPVSLQTIANAYGDYTRKSLEETRSFVEKLTGVRSLDKVMEVQTEFAKQAYQTFVAESQKIRELHSELARQTLKPLQGSAAKTTRDVR
jgi:phasin family protein